MASATTSNYMHDSQMGFLLNNVTWDLSAITSLYVALFTTVPALDGSGGVEVSTSSTGYARVAIARTAPPSAKWTGPSGSNREYSNIEDLQFAVPTANWGTITGCGLYTASTGGNLICVATLSTNKVVSLGDGAPKILAGQLRLSRSTC